MKWIANAALQKALSYCPGRERLKYFFQHRVTRYYPRSDSDYLHWIGIAVEHFTVFQENRGSLNLAHAHLYVAPGGTC